jgi:FkbM family methyltransferase
VLDTCLAVLRPGDVFYDIGANVGFIGVEIARKIPSASVIAFEPQATLAHTIALSAQLNNLCNLKVCELMIGEKVGQGRLFLPAHCIHASAVPREPDATETVCPITTLDEEVCNHRLPPPNVIKLDVEGSELAVFRGARQVLAKHRPWIVFEADDNMRRFNYTRDDIRKYLQEIAGYRLFFIGGDGLYHTDHDIENPEFRDLLACPPERIDELSGRVR